MKKKSTKNKLRYHNKLFKINLYVLFALILLTIPPENVYLKQITTKSSKKVRAQEVKIVLPSPPPYPVNTSGISVPQLTSEGILIQDIDSQVIIYSKNENKRFSPASTTKIVSALVALDHFKLDDVLTVNNVSQKGRVMGVSKGEQFTFESLLYGSLVHSANDATYVIADNYPGGVEKFVSRMNDKAKELRLVNTKFSNPVGFDGDSHYTTPLDLSKQAQAAIKNKIFAKIVSTRKITVSDISFSSFYDLVNVNKLLGQIQGVAGVKTGFTQNAGEILISEVKRNGKSVLFVVLKSEDRFGETKELIDWVFGNFKWVDIKEVSPVFKDHRF